MRNLFLLILLLGTGSAAALGRECANCQTPGPPPAPERALNMLKMAVGQTVMKATAKAWQNPAVSNAALKTVLADRCQDSVAKLQSDLRDCLRASSELIRALGMKLPNEQSLVVFQEELFELLKSEETLAYLRATHAFLKHPDGSENFWEWTLRHAKGDGEKALRWIAVLFQDTSGPGVEKFLNLHQARYGLPAEVVTLFSETNARVRDTRKLAYFPAPITSSSRSQYHFYVNAYLARKIRQAQPDNARMAALVPYLMDTAYASMKQHGRRPGAHPTIDSYQGLFKDPIAEAQAPGTGFPGASYLGYAGGQWGAGVALESIESYSAYARKYHEDPGKLIREKFAR